MSGLDEIMLAAMDYADERVMVVNGRSNAAGVHRSVEVLREMIAAELAAKGAEIERLNHAYHQQREDAQARVDAAVLRALTAERERDELNRVKWDLIEEIEANKPPAGWTAWWTKGRVGHLEDEVDKLRAQLADAERKGAEAMRAEAAKLARALPLYYGSGDEADESLAQAIEDLALPTGSQS